MSDSELVVGLVPTREVHRNLDVKALIDMALEQEEGVLAATGALVARTYERTGRSPKDKYVVQDADTKDEIWWDNNQPVDPQVFQKIWDKATAHLGERTIFVQDASACADPDYAIGVRVVTEFAWHALFAKQLFRDPVQDVPQEKSWTILGAPTLQLDASELGLNSEAFISIDFSGRRVLVVGTRYAGELKKSIFTVLNYLLPHQGVLPMHCSANVGAEGAVALFFGLSGTGKTTLSTDPFRRLIGDDEHGWSEHGIFNFEGGCYAKCINLSREKEPQIWDAIRTGSVVENAVVDPATGEVDYSDAAFTENTRVAYPLEFIPGAVASGKAGHAKTIIFLAADAFGVLPPVSKLTPEQAAYHYLSGFTSKLAGTEAGMGKDPEVTFSACFGAPFLPLHPTVYAEMLAEKIAEHSAEVYLVNTGWTGGSYGEGRRIDLEVTRKIVSAAVGGKLGNVPTRVDPVFGFEVPLEVEWVEPGILDPRSTWDDPGAYDAKAKDLASRFEENFAKFADRVTDRVKAAGPTI